MFTKRILYNFILVTIYIRKSQGEYAQNINNSFLLDGCLSLSSAYFAVLLWVFFFLNDLGFFNNVYV